MIFEDNISMKQKDMISLALELSESKADKIYIYGSSEAGIVSFNCFFEKKNMLYTINKLPLIGVKQLSNDRIFAFLKIGSEDFKELLEFLKKIKTIVTENRFVYKDKKIPAYEMIKFSVNMHRGCFGGCAFCTISAHQGKFIVSRSKASILKEVEKVTEMPDFKGYISDLGGPSANMYRMKGRDEAVCRKCKRPSCIYPKVCPNLNTDHRPLLDIYHAVDALPGIKKSFIGSGVRYDLLLHQSKDPKTNKSTQEYTRELIVRHVSGRLKVAPEHTSERVLSIMRKPPFSQFGEFKKIFDRINREEGLRQQLIPYFISSHPGCKEEDMAELAVITKRLDFHLEQVQDFTPTPMTVATEAWYTGFHPYTLEPVFSAKTQREKLAQRQFFFWYKPEERRNIINELRRIGRQDLIDKLYGMR